MSSNKLLITGAAIALLASAAIIVPSVASGAPMAGLFAPASVVVPDDGPGQHGRGNAFGHDKESPDFPGNRGHQGDHGGRGDADHGGGGDRAEKHDDGPGESGRGNAFGHRKDSPDFPGNGRVPGDREQPDE